MTPAFVAEYTLVGMSDAFMPPIDDQFRITPPPDGSIVAMPCFVPSITPLRLTPIVRSYSSSVMSASGCALPTPATFNTASTRPNASVAAANIAWTCASSVTSTWKGTTPSPTRLRSSPHHR